VEIETKHIRNACENEARRTNTKPAKFAYIVVQKRTTARFFLDSRDPSAGTVVSEGVVQSNIVHQLKGTSYDFYMISHHSHLGSPSPVHYWVAVSDPTFNEFLKPSLMQLLAFKMCHLYYNWPGSICIPAPLQYASRLVALVGQNLTRPVTREALCESLFFL